MKISTNQHSLIAQRYLGNSTKKVNLASQQLASGDRIINSAVDPSGLAISEKLKAGIKSFGQARRNINDGISFLQVAESDLANITDMAVRMKELSVQAASDTANNEAKAAIDIEFQGLKKEIDRIAANSSFNGMKLLDGTSKKYEFQIGIHGQKSANTVVYNTSELSSTTKDLGINRATIANKSGAQSALGQVDRMIEKLNAKRADAGTLGTRLISSINNNQIQQESFAAGNSRIRDTDIAIAASERASQKLVQAATTTMLKEANYKNKNAERLL